MFDLSDFKNASTSVNITRQWIVLKLNVLKCLFNIQCIVKTIANSYCIYLMKEFNRDSRFLQHTTARNIHVTWKTKTAIDHTYQCHL